MTTQQKNEIVGLIEAEITRLGSQSKVANKCQVSEATISQMMAKKWDDTTDRIWSKVASALGYSSDDWELVQTTNYRIITQVLNDAKQKSMFFAISEGAGAGKSAALKSYFEASNGGGIYLLSALEWGKRDFLNHLAKSLGLDVSRGYVSLDQLSAHIISHFQFRRQYKPILIIDEADKLKPSALRFLIPLYNACEGFLGCVISGTDNLEKEIRKGVKHNQKGFDEIDSRFGRSFVHLIGSTFQDVDSICRANGITAKETIKRIWQECTPVQKMWQNRSISVVTDLRRVKRCVLRELLIEQNQPEPVAS